MSHLHVKYLLVGGGVASSAAAKAIRAIDQLGSLLLVGQEISRPYHRPPLSKQYLRRQMSRAKLFVVEPDWYEENHVTLRTGRRASQLNTARMAVTLDSGEDISFDRLLLATGSVPTRLHAPGADLPGVHYVRTLEDCDRLHKVIDQARSEGRRHANGRGRAAVIGGGFLGVELAASMASLGVAVDLVLDAGYPWARFAGPNMGQLIALYLERQGVRIHPLAQPRRLEGDGRVQRVILADGAALDTDFVVAAVGATISRELLRGTAIAAEKAILTDASCRTSVAGIWAAGDCAAVYDPLFGKHRLADHWDHAMVTGTLAGRNMAGENIIYSGANQFSSEILEWSLSGWGEARLVERRLVRGDSDVEHPNLIEIGVGAQGQVTQILALRSGGTSIDSTEADRTLTQLVEQRCCVEGREESLKDPYFDLANLLT